MTMCVYLLVCLYNCYGIYELTLNSLGGITVHSHMRLKNLVILINILFFKVIRKVELAACRKATCILISQNSMTLIAWTFL